jgi:hypothetical protein
MRIRTIKPEFWAHPVMSRQSDSTKLLAIGLLNVADDEGYFFADARMIRNLIRPLDDDSRITTVSIRELSEIGYVELRKHESHGDIGRIPSFLLHQVINKPKTSKIKEFFDYGSNTVSIRDEYRLERKGTGSKGTGKGKGMELISCPISSDESEILKMIWSGCPKEGRERSGKQKLADAWRKIPAKDKPTKAIIENALTAWNASNKWQTGFCEGIEKWVKNRQWENLPESQGMTSTSIPDDEAVLLMGAIDSIRTSWQKIPWNNEDRAALIKYQKQLAALTDDDLQILKAYFESTAEGYFRPDNRSKFCESLSGIWTACERWKKATGYRAPNSRDSLYYGS